MNRWLIAAVVGLMASGCAVGVEDPDPVPAPPPGPARKAPPPAQTYSEEIVDSNELASTIHYRLDVPPVPVDVQPPMPGN